MWLGVGEGVLVGGGAHSRTDPWFGTSTFQNAHGMSPPLVWRARLGFQGASQPLNLGTELAPYRHRHLRS